MKKLTKKNQTLRVGSFSVAPTHEASRVAIQNTSSRIYLGTSGIVLPGPKATFPPEFQKGTRLHYYGSLFNTLEVNSSFYKVPLGTTFEKWASEVPDNFTFTIKLWRGITHEKNLAFNEEDIDEFMYAVNHVGNKKGCLLIQFPAGVTFNDCMQVERILKQLDEVNREADIQWQLAVEVRHVSWYQSDAYELLNRYNATLVFHDMPASTTPLDYPVNNLAYFRFHGVKGDYKGSYSENFLQQYAERVKQYRDADKTVYVYFNNTIDGALQNAQLFQTLI